LSKSTSLLELSMSHHTQQNHPASAKQSGFTLVELLVVIAIIGVLAAVGTQAYTGYTANAKKTSASANHSNALNFIQAELVKCSTGGTLSTAAGYSGTVPNCATGTPTIAALATHFTAYFRTANAGVKNPYNTSLLAANTTAGQPGSIVITSAAASGTTPATITVTTVTGASANTDVLTGTASFE
jgi:type IV pilus assembly protein PilA